MLEQFASWIRSWRRTSHPGMLEEPAPPADRWDVLHHSVRGLSHAGKNLPNQDCVEIWREESDGLPILLALADGHGSAKCPRSDVGARLAVQEAINCARELLVPLSENLSRIKQVWHDELPRRLDQRWKQAVDAHLAASPLLVKETAPLENEQSPAARKELESNQRLAYGATILLVALGKSYWAGLQLGDGDIVVVAEDGTASCPIEPDARLLANETTSLCAADAWHDVRTCFQAIFERPPALLLVASDGYANAFETPEGFLAVGPDLLNVLAEEGEKAVREELPDWLEATSREGSGDDVSLGIVWRTSAVAAWRNRIAARAARNARASEPPPVADASPADSIDP